jgi:hypothetical protein
MILKRIVMFQFKKFNKLKFFNFKINKFHHNHKINNFLPYLKLKKDKNKYIMNNLQ